MTIQRPELKFDDDMDSFLLKWELVRIKANKMLEFIKDMHKCTWINCVSLRDELLKEIGEHDE